MEYHERDNLIIPSNKYVTSNFKMYEESSLSKLVWSA